MTTGSSQTAVEPPPGLVVDDRFLTADEETDVVAVLERLTFEEVVLHGRAARRTVAHFGYGYEYGTGHIEPGAPMPDDLGWLRERAGRLTGTAPEALAEILVTRYPPGATIGWHRDAPVFGTVVGVSLLSSCRMRFRRRGDGRWLVFEQQLAPRSAYVLSGPARTAWQHSIPAVTALRYSVTFRTLRAHAAARGGK